MTASNGTWASSSLTLLIAAGIMACGFAVMISAGAATGLSGAAEEGAALRSGAPIVETAVPVKTKSSYTIEAAGRLRARDGTALVGEIAGKIIWISDNFILGGRLKEGELLFRIDPTDYEAAVKSAEAGLASATAQLAQAERAFDRRNDLVASGVVSEQANDDATANLAAARAGLMQAEAQLSQARKNLERTEIRSPYPARVVDETVAVDTYVAPGQQLGVVTDTRLGELQAGLTPKDTKALADMLLTGKRVKAIAKPNPGSISTGTLEGWVDRFNPVVDATSRTASVIALFPDAFEPQWDGKIFGDDFMTLEIEVAVSQNVWQVPVGAVRKEQFVWAVRDEKLKQIPVTVLSHDRDHSLVTSGQSLDGEAILTTLLNEEYEDQAVKVARRSVASRN